MSRSRPVSHCSRRCASAWPADRAWPGVTPAWRWRPDRRTLCLHSCWKSPMDLRRLGTETFHRVAPLGSTLQPHHWWLLALAATAGLLLWLIGYIVLERNWLLSAFGLFLLTYAAVVAAGSLPDEWISRRLDDVLDRWVRDHSGGGFYGMVALSVFVGMELEVLLDPREGLLSGWSFVEGQVVQLLIGFSVESLKNMIIAMIWPWPLIARAGLVNAAIFSFACWAVFVLARNW